MTAVLLGCTGLVAVVAMRWLPRASWPLRAPRTGIVVWLALSLTVIVSAVLAGLVLAMPCMRISIDPAVLRACLLIARARYATPAGAAAGVAGGLFVLAVLARLTWFTASALACAMRRRARHDDTLAVVARPGPAPGTVLLDEEQPVAYCLPGRRRIVITTGAMRCLDSRQFDAVVAHERAHLAGRHHLVLACSAALSRAFPHVRLFAVAAAQIRSLVEMAADDAAVRRGHRLDLAGALLALAAPPVPAGALAAAGTAAAERVRRLLAAPHPASIRRRALTAAAALAAASVLVCAPALAVISVSHCPARAGHHLTAAVSTGEEGR